MTYDFSGFKKRAKEIGEHLSKELSSIHTGRASVALLDGIMIESYGSRIAIPHVATISTEDARTLRIVPWDKANNKEVEKAINAASLGISVSVDDAGIRVFFPELTTERRIAFTKVVRNKEEDARVAVKGEREKVKNDIVDKEREGIINEDDKVRALEELQKLVNETNDMIEALGDKKEREIMG
ncbi:MAG: Ribosome-recycling factor [Parcubacteria group bacterium GW2011_GWA1_47_8]|nr:MAG: Ribosome-recycling factor [Parcubacteria group bacterium GW2011_GWA1_47_8]KKW07309.1 MAG: Ribosome-recycling factor [Parcubacteria group bacterium GW2011_GWA2_49_16]